MWMKLVFFGPSYQKTLSAASQAVHGIKNSKERIAVSLTSRLIGDKLKPWAIAKSSNPRCFKNIDKTKLPVKYRNNKKAWMNAMTFQEYIQDFNEQMRKQN